MSAATFKLDIIASSVVSVYLILFVVPEVLFYNKLLHEAST